MQNIDAQRLSRVLGWAGVLPFAALSLASAVPINLISAQWALAALTLRVTVSIGHSSKRGYLVCCWVA